MENDLANIFGEVLWHSVTSDPNIVPMSHFHKDKIKEYVDKFLPRHSAAPIRFLEVAAYAHFSGDLLENEFGWDVTLSDISSQTLKLGKKIAEDQGINSLRCRRVTVDFHELPFESGSFDVVYIASALHHTLEWKTVLSELQRVTADGGILILQNEPCRREFCFNKFATNRRESFRPVEVELWKSGAIRTVAEAYFGSRPESLFGMIENQNMPVQEILESLTSSGTLRYLHLEEAECISEFEKELLKFPRDALGLNKKIQTELAHRLTAARNVLTDIDIALGFTLPTSVEIAQMANKISEKICSLPNDSDDQYRINLAKIFGAALTAVMQKTEKNRVPEKEKTASIKGILDGIETGYPARIAHLLDQSDDLLPEIQSTSALQLEACFPNDQWHYRSDFTIKSVALKQTSGKIKLLKDSLKSGQILILIRLYAHVEETGYRICLFVNSNKIAIHEIFQSESFMLKGVVDVEDETNISVLIESIQDKPMISIPPVTICAIRAVWLPKKE